MIYKTSEYNKLLGYSRIDENDIKHIREIIKVNIFNIMDREDSFVDCTVNHKIEAQDDNQICIPVSNVQYSKEDDYYYDAVLNYMKMTFEVTNDN